jgi:hypothetical protein
MDRYVAAGDSAELEISLYVNRTNTTANATNRVFYATSSNWTETELTWNNKPAISSTLLADLPGTIVPAAYTPSNRFSFDVSPYAWQQYGRGYRTISFNATQASDPGSSHDFDYASKETPDPRKLPYIVVKRVKKQTSGLANPGSATLSVFPTLTDGIVYVSSASDVDYSLTDLQGRQLLSGKISAQERNTVDLTALGRGIYLLKAADRTYKIVRR